jgi:hypothetical protein
MVLAAQGVNSTLLMEHDVYKGRHGIKGQDWSSNAKDYSFWPRWNQPCQGGELRKYASVHGKECTQPLSGKPGDLHHPFPEGNPVAVGVRFYGGAFQEKYEDILQHLFSQSSPYRRGVGQARLVKDGSNIVGAVIEDTKKVDPTAMVNLFQFINSSLAGAGISTVRSIMDAGATINEALLILMLGSSVLNAMYKTYEYYYASKMSVRRFLDGDVNDLSHGISFYDRGDYNRIDVSKLFWEDDTEKAMIWTRDMADQVEVVNPYGSKWKGDFIKDVLPVALERIREKYKEEPSVMKSEKPVKGPNVQVLKAEKEKLKVKKVA